MFVKYFWKNLLPDKFEALISRTANFNNYKTATWMTVDKKKARENPALLF
jgi:hypothetical protein